MGLLRLQAICPGSSTFMCTMVLSLMTAENLRVRGKGREGEGWVGCAVGGA